MLTEPSRTNTYIAQGEFALGSRPEEIISTTLGSCVAVCLWDRHNRIGGMNHILLPDSPGLDIRTQSVGAGAMELLINGLLKAGAHKTFLDAKFFGGSAVVAGLSNIGKRNAEFAANFLASENIPVLSSNVGGSAARRVQFWPESGRVRLKLVETEEVAPVKAAPAKPESNDLELF